VKYFAAATLFELVPGMNNCSALQNERIWPCFRLSLLYCVRGVVGGLEKRYKEHN
jgi:hypothetical protein